LDMADELARSSETPYPDFPLPPELAALASMDAVSKWLVHKQSPDKKGMGYFSKETLIPAGTVLLIAKPLSMAMDWEDDDDEEEEEETEDKEGDEQQQKQKQQPHPEPLLNSKIVLRLLEAMQQSQNLWTNKVSKLYPRTQQEVDALPPIITRCRKVDADDDDDDVTANIQKVAKRVCLDHSDFSNDTELVQRLSLIVRYNVMSIETGPELLSHPVRHASLRGAGLYYEPSFFNHCTNPNVSRYAVGDVMWFVANQDILPNQEACISYIEHDILCEPPVRRNRMLCMDFVDKDIDNDNDDDAVNGYDDEDEEDYGPEMPVVDSQLQNELMQMNPFERIVSIQELLAQAQGKATLNEDKVMDDEDDAGWFLCDFYNLLVLLAITMDSLGQNEAALDVWEECVEFAEIHLPDLDESAIVMSVQAALCAFNLGDAGHIQQAKEHAQRALSMHNTLFGGGVERLRRRYQSDFSLSLRKSKNGSGGDVAAAEKLWPLPEKQKRAKRAKGLSPGSTVCLFAVTLLLTLSSMVVTAFTPTKLSTSRLSLLKPSFLQNSLVDVFEAFSREYESLSVPDFQKMLVQKGVDFQQQHKRQRNQKLHQWQSSLEKVPGCVANVHVQTNFKKDTEDDWEITFEGTADALLSRGLLAVLTTAISSTRSLEDILAVDPYVVADRMGIRRALSPGRNDGVASMTQVIQQQIAALLQENKGLPLAGDDAPLFVDATSKEMPTAKQFKDGLVLGGNVVTSPSVQSGVQSTKTKGSVALLLSGGVDSSVALRLLMQEGYDVTAFYLKIWLEDELAHLGHCPWEDDYNVCRQVCDQAGVPLETFSLQEEYRDRVIAYTIEEAQRGRTPNPDILCNSRIKFGCFYDAIEEREFDFVASGHYARLERDGTSDTNVRLFRAPDKIKDQSYFLCALSQEQLRRVIFPLGHLQKSEVRELAESFALPNRNRADSQGLCFLGKVKFDEFLSAYLGERPGDIIDAATGELLGRHKGVWFHTVGQRKGIGKVLDPLATSRGPWYVVAKDPDQNIVFCSNQYDEEIFASARSEFHVEDVKWIAGVPPGKMAGSGVGRFEMKIRHGPRLVAGTFQISNSAGTEGTVQLDQKDGGLAPGQYVVLYDGEECLGGGVISERHWAKFLLDRSESSAAVAYSI